MAGRRRKLTEMAMDAGRVARGHGSLRSCPPFISSGLQALPVVFP